MKKNRDDWNFADFGENTKPKDFMRTAFRCRSLFLGCLQIFATRTPNATLKLDVNVTWKYILKTCV